MTQKKAAVATPQTVKNALALVGKAKMPARRFEVRYSLANSNWHWQALAKGNKVTLVGNGRPTARKAVQAIQQEMKALGALSDLHITVISNLHGVADQVFIYPSEAYAGLRKQILTEALGKDLKFLPPALPRPVTRTKVSVRLPKGTKDPQAALSKIQDDIVAAKKKPAAKKTKVAVDPYLKGITERGSVNPGFKAALGVLSTAARDTGAEACKAAIVALTPKAREVRGAVSKAGVRMVSGLKEVGQLATKSAKQTKALLK